MPLSEKKIAPAFFIGLGGAGGAIVDELVLAGAAYSPAKMSAQVDTWTAQIEQALALDRRKPFSCDATSTLSLLIVDSRRGAAED